MTHPLEKYRAIAKQDFIVHVEERFYTSYHDELINGLHVEIEKDKDRMYLNGVDLDGNGFEGYTTLSSYLLKEYDKLEKETRSNIDNAFLTLLGDNKQDVFIKSTIAELQTLQDAIKQLSIQPKHEEYRKLLLRQLSHFTELIQAIYQPERKQVNNSPESKSLSKLRWLGKTNILTTLFYDLSKGNSSTNTPKLIDATPKEIELFIVNNFTDKDGNDFPLNSTIETNLKKSKQSTKRANDSLDLNSYYNPE